MALGRDLRKRIEADRTLGVADVEVADRVGAFGRDGSPLPPRPGRRAGR